MEPLLEFSGGHNFLDLISVITSGGTGDVGMWVLKSQLGNELSGCGKDISQFRLNVSCWSCGYGLIPCTDWWQVSQALVLHFMFHEDVEFPRHGVTLELSSPCAETLDQS